MSEPSKLDALATSVVQQARNTWNGLVDLAFLLPEDRIDGAAQELSKHMGQSKDNLRRKINAIQYARTLAYSADEIKAYGQEATLGRYIKSRNAERYEQVTVMKWNLPGSLREVIRQDMAAIAKILGFVSSEQLWDFLHSIFVDLKEHPESLRRLAGELKGKDDANVQRVQSRS